ncbi:MAG: hypothetical protein NC548_22885 [Lachnospiraceae bacterium]|nr:hypothetical protein [Lachnospiraceae bacterium]
MKSKIMFFAEDEKMFETKEECEAYEEEDFDDIEVFDKYIHAWDYNGESSIFSTDMDYANCEYLQIDSQRAAEYFLQLAKEESDSIRLPWGISGQLEKDDCCPGTWFRDRSENWVDYEDVDKYVQKAKRFFEGDKDND